MKHKQLIFISLSAFITMITASYCTKPVADQNDHAEIREQGDFIIDTTFKVLSGNLKTAMMDSGAVYAIQYCNLNAMPLVDTLSNRYNVKISRKTKQARNPANQADDQDKIYLRSYELRLKRGEELHPMVVEQGNRYFYYKPILIQPMCQTCHGSPEMIGPAYETITSLYPDDKAINYNAGDLRGVWRIDFTNL